MTAASPFEPSWTATVRVSVGEPRVADWLARALAPESAREVPRASAQIVRGPGASIEVVMRAHDPGALRAALNTYLGWIQLSLATADAATVRPPAPTE